MILNRRIECGTHTRSEYTCKFIVNCTNPTVIKKDVIVHFLRLIILYMSVLYAVYIWEIRGVMRKTFIIVVLSSCVGKVQYCLEFKYFESRLIPIRKIRKKMWEFYKNTIHGGNFYLQSKTKTVCTTFPNFFHFLVFSKFKIIFTNFLH